MLATVLQTAGVALGVVGLVVAFGALAAGLFAGSFALLLVGLVVEGR